MQKLFKLHFNVIFIDNTMYSNQLKRPLDKCIALCALVFLSPFCLLITILISLFDPGPVIFCQSRVGRGGHVFDFYKFRTMPLSTGDIPSDQIGDVRLSWIGALLRRTNLDEVPQLFNVLKGDMSIVGPRPSIPSQQHLTELRRKNGALTCYPGLTGLAQINAFNGMSAEKKAEFDGQYAASISFSGDIRIVCRTFSYLLKPPPKY